MSYDPESAGAKARARYRGYQEGLREILLRAFEDSTSNAGQRELVAPTTCVRIENKSIPFSTFSLSFLLSLAVLKL